MQAQEDVVGPQVADGWEVGKQWRRSRGVGVLSVRKEEQL